jgi:hypothetical protein
MSKIFLIDPQTGNNYQGDDQTVTNVKKTKRFYSFSYIDLISIHHTVTAV